MNPFVYQRLRLDAPQGPEVALAALDRLLREGVDASGRHYVLFGARRGRYLSMSLGMPLLGGGAPVLRAWLRDSAGPPCFDVSVTSRIEVIVLGGFWILLIVVGAVVQLTLQVSAYLAGRASAGEVWSVLPSIAVMVALIGAPLWYLRRRGRTEAVLLVQAFRDAIGAAPGSAASPIS